MSLDDDREVAVHRWFLRRGPGGEIELAPAASLRCGTRRTPAERLRAAGRLPDPPEGWTETDVTARWRRPGEDDAAHAARMAVVREHAARLEALASELPEDPGDERFSVGRGQPLMGRNLVRSLRRMSAADAARLARLDARIVALQRERAALVRAAFGRGGSLTPADLAAEAGARRSYPAYLLGLDARAVVLPDRAAAGAAGAPEDPVG